MTKIDEEKIRESIKHIDDEKELGIEPNKHWTERSHVFNLIYRMSSLFGSINGDIPYTLIVKQLDLVIERAEKYRDFLKDKHNISLGGD